MADVIFIAVILVFFGLCALYTRMCDRIIGPDIEAFREGDSGTDGISEQEADAVTESVS